SSLALSLRAKAGRAELARVQRLHETIVQAVAGQDAPAARRAMTEHFDDAECALQRLGDQREE
ncbi:MAG: FCD domain-containing protein, partial [Janthinobacterium lividum]